ncbi:hypothetical protein BMMON3_17710 [Burkholderia mallei]
MRLNGGDGRLPVGVDSAVLGRFDAGAPCFDGEGAWGGEGPRKRKGPEAPKAQGPEIERPRNRQARRTRIDTRFRRARPSRSCCAQTPRAARDQKNPSGFSL